MKLLNIAILLLLIVIIVVLIKYGHTSLETFKELDEIHVHCSYHIGDSILNLRYILHIYDEIKTNKHINYYLKSEYIPQLQDWVENTSIQLRPLEEKPENSFEMWMATNKLPLDNMSFEPFMKQLYFQFKERFNIVKPLDTPENTMYFPDKTLKKRYEELPEKYKNIDVLVINGACRSEQCDNEGYKKQWPEVCRYLHSKYKIATTEKIEDIPCTRDDNLTLKDIAAISTHAKYIVGTHTGPTTGCYNSYALQNVKQWFFLRIPPVQHEYISAHPLRYPNEVMQYL